MTTSELLRKSADRIDRVGWVQGSYALIAGKPGGCLRIMEDSPTCLVGAIRAESGGEWYGDQAAAEAAKEAMRRHLGTRYIADWNDEPGRTAAEVSAALREAARLAEQNQPGAQ